MFDGAAFTLRGARVFSGACGSGAQKSAQTSQSKIAADRRNDASAMPPLPFSPPAPSHPNSKSKDVFLIVIYPGSASPSQIPFFGLFTSGMTLRAFSSTWS